LRALEGKVEARRDYDLVEAESHALAEIVAKFRAWLGLAPARMRFNLPSAVGYGLAAFADLAGWLGWRSPLRTTALRVLAHDVKGDAHAWAAAGGHKLKSL